MGRPKVKNNIHEIARLSDVSISTVSRVINHPESVKPETIARVKSVMHSLKYDFQEKEYKRKNEQCRNIAFIMTPTHDEISIFSQMLVTIANILSKYNCRLLAFVPTTDSDDGDEIISFALENNVEGIILGRRLKPSTVVRISSFFQTIQCFEYVAQSGCAFVSTDFSKAMGKLMNHLFSLGQKKIAFMSLTDEEGYSAYQRKAAFMECLQKRGIRVQPEWIIQISPPVSFDRAVSAATRLLSLPERPEALVCTSDVFAAAAIRSAHTLNLRVPEDFIVVGGDNNVASRISFPMITTINHHMYEIACTTAEVMIEMIENPEKPPQHILYDAELILRESSDRK